MARKRLVTQSHSGDFSHQAERHLAIVGVRHLEISEYLPPLTILWLYVFFEVISFPNNLAASKTGNGSTLGDSVLALFVTFTGFAGRFIGLGVLGVLFWFNGWKVPVGTFGISFGVGLIVIAFIREIPYLWFLCTILMWPVSYFLMREVATQYF